MQGINASWFSFFRLPRETLRTEKPMLFFKPFVIDLFECFEVILNTPIVG
jgi:hypothetical protein